MWWAVVVVLVVVVVVVVGVGCWVLGVEGWWVLSVERNMRCAQIYNHLVIFVQWFNLCAQWFVEVVCR